jgi:hypothetical protein
MGPWLPDAQTPWLKVDPTWGLAVWPQVVLASDGVTCALGPSGRLVTTDGCFTYHPGTLTRWAPVKVTFGGRYNCPLCPSSPFIDFQNFVPSAGMAVPCKATTITMSTLDSSRFPVYAPAYATHNPLWIYKFFATLTLASEYVPQARCTRVGDFPSGVSVPNTTITFPLEGSDGYAVSLWTLFWCTVTFPDPPKSTVCPYMLLNNGVPDVVYDARYDFYTQFAAEYATPSDLQSLLGRHLLASKTAAKNSGTPGVRSS